MSELETLERALAGANLARYGDGEYNHCFGKKNVSQPADKNLTREMREILLDDDSRCLPCIPNVFSKTPKAENWLRYAGPDICGLLRRDMVYGSSFVSRPDSAPWIDTPEYWDRVRSFWRGKDVILVAGTERSLRLGMMPEAASVERIDAPSGQRGDGAYAAIDQLMEQIGQTSKPVLLCLGPTATVMAWRLAKRDVHAIDLGHIGMFMRSAGAYRYQLSDLISVKYRALLEAKHRASKGWGGDGAKHGKAVRAICDELNPETILDYGCGQMALANELKPRRVSGYDAGIPERSGMPKPCELVVCTDVLEHVEPKYLHNVLGHLQAITLKMAYVVIATRPAREILPNGANAHLIVEPGDWWLTQLAKSGWTRIDRVHVDAGEAIFRCWK